MKKKLTEKSEYAGRSKKSWIAWAKKEVKEYLKFIAFLEDGQRIERANRLPDSICDLPHCTICQKYRKEHGFDVKGRKKLIP